MILTATRSFTLPPGFRNSAFPRICNRRESDTIHYLQTLLETTIHCLQTLLKTSKRSNVSKIPRAYLASYGVGEAVDANERCVADGLHETPPSRPSAARAGEPNRWDPREVGSTLVEEEVAGDQGYGGGCPCRRRSRHGRAREANEPRESRVYGPTA